ncbi:hypothetical protein CALCODRAFT_354028 [Calocera cornea HHB12733]|uniref:Protein kinase domain-containing protein n=1 Tax=Calocera cornea HHB12733 TaxID=1353952 RepID=A0A165EQT8_9BASI|nr:hypothetical protein CALCODRAFT_354028 [Calocera cornea HHB12733]
MCFPRNATTYNDRIQAYDLGKTCIGGSYVPVYRVELKDGGLVASKSLFHKTGATAYRMSLREACKCFNVQHPNIVPFLGIDILDYPFTRWGGYHISLVSAWMEEGNIIQYLQHAANSDRLAMHLNFCTLVLRPSYMVA